MLPVIRKFANSPSRRNPEFAFSTDYLPPIDLYQQLKKSGDAEMNKDSLVIRSPTMEQNGLAIPLDIHTWLPFSAPHYHISPNIEDYVLTPVIVMPSDLPNRNAVAFPLSELTRFHPSEGRQAYKTWKGKPTHYEHQNEDITKAYGVIADSHLRKMVGFANGKLWKVLLLLAFDRTKHPDVVNKILAGTLNSYSMGAWVTSYTCSYCNEEVGKGCPHLDPKKSGEIYVLNGKLVFKNCIDIVGFETSIVETPAYASAISDTLIKMREDK